MYRLAPALSVQTVLTPGLYSGPGIYAGIIFYQIILKFLIFATNISAPTSNLVFNFSF